MKITDYRNYLSELEKLTDKVKFFAHYSHEMYPFNIFYQCGNFSEKEVFELFYKTLQCNRTPERDECFDSLAKGISKYTGTCYARFDTDFLIKVPNIQYSARGISKIAHEAQHATIQLSLEIGNRLSYKGQEAWCYLIDDIVEKYFIFQHDAIEGFLKRPKTTEYLLLSK